MENIILKDIIEEASDKIIRYQSYHNNLELAHKRNSRRISNAPAKVVKTPEEWADNRLHNPFYVMKRKEQISKSIARKILEGSYKPNPPYLKSVKKKGGGEREISVYQIPDAAVSDRFYKNLLAKNRHRFSSLSYAYRNDRNVHFAIQDIALELSSSSRLYIAEFDFSNFFGSINNDHLFKQLDENSFLVSPLERRIIEAFLEPFDGKGIPQGTSISLFLANLACWNLDRAFENEGIRFARYADDTIVWTRDYTKIGKSFDIISRFSKETGIALNLKKSEGISLLQSSSMPSELTSPKEFVEFLGYRISNKSVGIKLSSVNKIKNQISYILYRNLLQPLTAVKLKALLFPANDLDKDYVTAIMQIRRYLYGNLTEVTLRKYLNGTYSQLSFKGIMSFYPLINDEDQMIELDRWLLSTILNTLKKRKRLLLKTNPHFNTEQFPFNCKGKDLIRVSKKIKIYHKEGLVQLPSFMRIHKALKKGLIEEGIEKVMHPKSNYYYE